MKKEIVTALPAQDYEALLQRVGETLSRGRAQATAAVNSTMVRTYC